MASCRERPPFCARPILARRRDCWSGASAPTSIASSAPCSAPRPATPPAPTTIYRAWTALAAALAAHVGAPPRPAGVRHARAVRRTARGPVVPRDRLLAAALAAPVSAWCRARRASPGARARAPCSAPRGRAGRPPALPSRGRHPARLGIRRRAATGDDPRPRSDPPRGRHQRRARAPGGVRQSTAARSEAAALRRVAEVFQLDRQALADVFRVRRQAVDSVVPARRARRSAGEALDAARPRRAARAQAPARSPCPGSRARRPRPTATARCCRCSRPTSTTHCSPTCGRRSTGRPPRVRHVRRRGRYLRVADPHWLDPLRRPPLRPARGPVERAPRLPRRLPRRVACPVPARFVRRKFAGRP